MGVPFSILITSDSKYSETEWTKERLHNAIYTYNNYTILQLSNNKSEWEGQACR